MRIPSAMDHALLSADPATLTTALRALQLAGLKDWSGAHEQAQSGEDRDSAWVHAFLHRQEGDESNAQYWYLRSGRASFRGTLDEEWRHIADTLSKRL